MVETLQDFAACKNRLSQCENKLVTKAYAGSMLLGYLMPSWS